MAIRSSSLLPPIVPTMTYQFEDAAMRRRFYPRKPAPDDHLAVPAGYMRCCWHSHVGPRILPAKPENFKIRRSRPGGLDPICRECHNRDKRDYDARMRPYKRWRSARFAVSGQVALLLRGPAFAVPTRLPRGTLACSRSFEVKRFTKKNFDMNNDRVEPVCNDCRKRIQDTAADSDSAQAAGK